MTSGYIRHPRAVVVTDEGRFNPLEVEVNVSKHQSSDTFSAKIPLDGPNGLDESYWSEKTPINITVLGTNDIYTGSLIEMFSGVADEVEINLDDRTAHVSGRDKTSKLLDAKTNEKWLNKKPQDIITDLAGRAGLSVQFSGTAADRAGLKFNQDFNRISELDSQWNVIVRLAKQIGCTAFVKGGKLLIQPWDADAGSYFNIHYVKPTPESYADGSFISLRMKRDLHLSKKVKVNHKSWGHKTGEAIESEYEYEGAGDEVLTHSLKGANLTKQQQDAIAMAHLDAIVGHERSLSISMPGDVGVDPTMMANLTGTATSFDQQYVISTISHDWSYDGGYRMTITTRNKDKKRKKAKKIK